MQSDSGPAPGMMRLTLSNGSVIDCLPDDAEHIRGISERMIADYTPPPRWIVEVEQSLACCQVRVWIKGPIKTTFLMVVDWRLDGDGDRTRLAHEIIEKALPIHGIDRSSKEETEAVWAHRRSLRAAIWSMFYAERRARQQRNMGMGWEPGLRNGLAIPSHAENMAAMRRHQPITCADCQAGPLTEFHTSKRDGRTICQACFDKRADKGLAREAGQPIRKKTRHPLDAWMEDLPQEAP